MVFAGSSPFGGAPFNPPDNISITLNSSQQLQASGSFPVGTTYIRIQPTGSDVADLYISASGTTQASAWNISSSGTSGNTQLNINWGSSITDITFTQAGKLTVDAAGHTTLIVLPSGDCTVTGYIQHYGEQLSVAAKTSAYTLTANDDVVTCNASSAAFTVTLPSATGSGQKYLVIKTDSSTNAVTLAAAGTDTIEGSSTKSLASQYNKIAVVDIASGLWADLGTGGGI